MIEDKDMMTEEQLCKINDLPEELQSFYRNLSKFTDWGYVEKMVVIGFRSVEDKCTDDRMIIPHIPGYMKKYAIKDFKCDQEERLIWFRDTSSFNDRDEGLVLTDFGYHYIPGDGYVYSVSWKNIVKVYYQDEYMYFKSYDGSVRSMSINLFTKNSYDRTGNEIAFALNHIAQNVGGHTENEAEDCIKYYVKCVKEERYDEAIKVALEIIHNGYGAPSYWYNIIEEIYLMLEDNDKAFEYCNRGLNACVEENLKNSDDIKVGLWNDRSYYFSLKGDILSARKDIFSVMTFASDQKNANDNLLKDEAYRFFQEAETYYVENFLTIPYNERKVLMPVKEYVDLHQDRVSVIRMDNLPAIKFPMGHPIANQLYVGHPLIPSKYIPFENYQLELVQDKVREFCMLAQSLGATEISIECLNSSSSNEMGSNQQNISGEAGNRLLKGKGEYHQDRSRQMIDELSHFICIHQTFTPCNKPSIPENMVWYDDEPSWQRLVSQRLSGGLTSHEERIETKKSQMVEGRELTELKAEVNSLYVDMNMSISEEEEAKFTQQENAVLAIKVKFAPINQLTGTVIESNINLGGTVKEKVNALGKFAKKMSSNIVDTIKRNTSLTSSEEEYLKEFKDILADGEISSRERRLLEKIRIQLGISEDRSAELENSLSTSTLTPEEQEYFDEYQELIADGNISDRDQRFLDKLKKANDISEERAKEIEKMCSKFE